MSTADCDHIKKKIHRYTQIYICRWEGSKRVRRSHIFRPPPPIRLVRGQARAMIMPKHCSGGLLYFAILDRGNMMVVLYEQYFSNRGYELTPNFLGRKLQVKDLLETNSYCQKKHTIQLVSLWTPMTMQDPFSVNRCISTIRHFK